MNLPHDSLSRNEVIAAAVRQLHEPDPRTRESAVEQLVRCGDDALPSLLDLLAGESDTARIAACEALHQLRSPLAIPDLCRAAIDPSPELRLVAVRALSVLEPGSLFEPLQVVVLNGNETAVEAAELLARLGDYCAFPALAQLLSRVAGPGRERVLLALGRLGDPCAVPLLWESLVVGSTAEQVAAAKALLEIRGTGGSPSPEVYAALRDALVRLGTSHPGLLARLCVDDRFASDVCNEAVIQLGDRGERALREVLKRHDSFDLEARRRAVRLLARMTDNAIPLVRALSDPAPEVRAEAALALASFPHRSASRALASVLANEHEHASVKACAGIALVEQGTVTEELLERVVDALSLERPLRERAAHTLVRVAESGALVDLNRAVRELADLSRSRTLPGNERAVYAEALRQIKLAGDRLTDLPLPSERVPANARSLPRPAAGSPRSAESLPQPSPQREVTE